MTTKRLSLGLGVMAIAALLASDATAGGGARFAVDVGGVSAGWLHTVAGATADADHLDSFKHVADAKAELTVEVDSAMDSSFWEWVRGSFVNKHARKDGSIHVIDTEAKAVASLEFTNALISEVTFPPIEGDGSAVPPLKLRLQPSTMAQKKGSGKLDTSKYTAATQKGQPVPKAFQFDFAGCGQPCTKATSLGAARFTVGKDTLGLASIRVRVPKGPSVDEWTKKKDPREGSLSYLSAKGGALVAFKLHGLKPTHITQATTSAGPAVDLELAVGKVEVVP